MKQENNDVLLKQRHSLAHVLAQAVQQIIDPDISLGTGPAVEHGFYYDMLFSDDIKISEDDLKTLTKTMQGIIKMNQQFVLYTAKDKEEALHILSLLDKGDASILENIKDSLKEAAGKIAIVADPEIISDTENAELYISTSLTRFKKELVEKFDNAAQQAGNKAVYTFYFSTIPQVAADKLLTNVKHEYKVMYKKLTDYIIAKNGIAADQFITFADLCEWPHVATTKEIPDGSFVLDKIAGAYWQANENNPQMTRIYGLAYETKDELKNYQTMLEEAKKRDHRILGQKLKLFTISDLVGSGLPLFQPNGAIIRKELEDYLWELHKDKWYSRVRTPHLAKEDLYKVSGHAGHYLEDMFKVHGGSSNEDFFMKPMNCPHHMQIFADNQFSYRDMPIRYFEPATVYRDEKTGQLAGLSRVRAITQDDGHLFCRIWQIHQEVTTIVEIIKEFYTTMHMLEWYRVRLSLRGDDKEHYLGSDEVREKAEGALKEVCESQWLPYKPAKWEAAFYGPKLDFMFKDAIGREWQLATCQLDFNLPNRFQLSFVNENGEKETPVVIHRAISWSLERFISVMIEHFGGAFPLWLAPTQILFVPVANAFLDTCYEWKSICEKMNLRAKIDTSDDSFSKKIRNGELDKIPYIVIIGEKEVTEKTFSVRVFKTKEQFSINAQTFLDEKLQEYKERK